MKLRTLVFLILLLLSRCSRPSAELREATSSARFRIGRVEVNDGFWRPRFDLWQSRTVNDVFDKFEGKYTPQGEYLEKDFKILGGTRNAFTNFDLVAEGKRGIGVHHGPPWYDGLVYETIRGAADLMAHRPDSALERRIDDYIDRIVRAQASDPDGYLNTYTQLMEPDHRWGFNGGMLRWQHDVYNAGMLVEAGIHYYRATGKTKLLAAAVKYANYMYSQMGPPPKRNVVPAHSGPEEALIKLYKLFQEEPGLKSQVGSPVHEKDYFQLARFWIDTRGHHAGLPLWKLWGDARAEAWIREAKYTDPEFGNHSRPTWGDYSQDSIPVEEQKTIEGHAVRATLLATGLTTAAILTGDSAYIRTARAWWDNMVGRRMFVTGGVGAIARDEKFGADYYLPNDSYLETCAAVGAGFFSQRMNQLTQDGMFMDEFERVLYNNVLTGISLSGDQYTYQNPLMAAHHHRWGWHDCPCCPPMFLKMVAAVPEFIYSGDPDGIIVNLFIGSTTEVMTPGNTSVTFIQKTNYPWEGTVSITIEPDHDTDFTVRIRIPGWALGRENPFGLYMTKLKGSVALSVNGVPAPVVVQSGYAAITRMWKRGDRIELKLPMQPRVVTAHEKATDLNGLYALSSGPLVYCFEQSLNASLRTLKPDASAPMEIEFDSKLLGGINTIVGKAYAGSKTVRFKAVPYFTVGNLQKGEGYEVWVPGH